MGGWLIDPSGQAQLGNILRLLGELVEAGEGRLVGDDEQHVLLEAQGLLRQVHDSAVVRTRALLEHEPRTR